MNITEQAQMHWHKLLDKVVFLNVISTPQLESPQQVLLELMARLGKCSLMGRTK